MLRYTLYLSPILSNRIIVVYTHTRTQKRDSKANFVCKLAHTITRPSDKGMTPDFACRVGRASMGSSFWLQNIG